MELFLAVVYLAFGYGYSLAVTDAKDNSVGGVIAFVFVWLFWPVYLGMQIGARP